MALILNSKRVPNRILPTCQLSQPDDPTVGPTARCSYKYLLKASEADSNPLQVWAGLHWEFHAPHQILDQVAARRQSSTPDLGRLYRRGTTARTGGADLQCILYHQTSGGPEWDCPSAGPSSNRMAAACGPPTPDGAQPFSSAYPAKSLRMRPHSQATSVC